ncbi:LysR substrate-binding domain-containing protein [Parvibaculum sp.]|uniref:LysR substrate-binding domain-containing protein n=1 Tax=Parvibaculum sp. TaxID=2024848 RepID=UPI00272189FE|nr:LysR substrate-binding domain-containing protein [Parvibaculum sp.]MDO9127549.1 LysR substrate-binding domain-containing protein [Parvibaculum sp.]MDP1626662.1 LysR substrate-binding domain-containing protein [Parvibaculum sp.]MDP2150583.1 LysR substrate-binding domain-containing protein [Parvibaculum sp.]MDP3330051.1 LysR substrate-binding domain-containing protein [Parvibaculum sp.]
MTNPPGPRRDLPPLGALKAFEAVARLGSLTAAADELFVTHGAVSRHVRALEDWAGAKLFDRVGKRLKLTDAGRAYRDAAALAFDGIAAASARLRESAGSARVLVVNALPTFAMRWLLPRLARFQRLEPQVELKLVTSDEDVSRLAHGSYHVAIRREQEPWPANLVGASFLAEREIPVASPSLLERLPVRSAADLARHTLLHADTRPGAWTRWLAAADAGEVEASAGRQHFDHFYLTLQAASDGLGIALGPLPIIGDDIRAGRLVAPLAAPVLPSRPYCWLTPEPLAGDRAIAAFCTWLEEEGMIENET